ncbi:MAG: hypothetical protein Q9224_007125, partial [Gallowayella concinna]
ELDTKQERLVEAATRQYLKDCSQSRDEGIGPQTNGAAKSTKWCSDRIQAGASDPYASKKRKVEGEQIRSTTMITGGTPKVDPMIPSKWVYHTKGGPDGNQTIVFGLQHEPPSKSTEDIWWQFISTDIYKIKARIQYGVYDTEFREEELGLLDMKAAGTLFPTLVNSYKTFRTRRDGFEKEKIDIHSP